MDRDSAVTITVGLAVAAAILGQYLVSPAQIIADAIIRASIIIGIAVVVGLALLAAAQGRSRWT